MIDIGKIARILGGIIWVLIVGALMWWWSATAAEAQSGQLCYKITPTSSNCQPVSPTTPYPVKGFGIATVAAPTYVEGAPSPFSFDLSGSLRVAATFSPSGTQNVNLTQILGAAPSLSNPLWVFPATGATFPVSGTVAATQSTSPWVVSNSGTFAVQAAITAASGSFASGSQSIGITPTDRTITSASGSSQQIAAALATRKSLTIVNTGNANCGVNPTGGTAAIGGAGTLTLAPFGAYTPRVPTLSAVTIICTAGQPIYADES